MKPLPLILSVSLVLNLGLLITFFISAPPFSSASTSSPSESTLSENSSVSKSTTVNANPSPGLPRQRSHLWSKLNSDDLDQLLTRLKNAGFTYQQIRAVVLAVGGKKFEDAEAEILSQQPKTPYWKPEVYLYGRAPDFRVKHLELMQQRSAFYRKYFSSPEALAADEDAAERARQQYGALPLEKLQALTRIRADYNEIESKIRTERIARTNPQYSVDDRQKQRLLDAERERDIKQVLSPEEFAEYQLRESPTAQRLREQLELLRLTEAEYKTIFNLQRPIDEAIDSWSPDENQQKAYKDALKNLAPQLEAALGSERYADYQQLTESPNDQVTTLMARLDLPLATAGKINALRDSANSTAKILRNDTILAPADRDIRLATLARETETKLGTLLRTPRGYEAYTELKGDWLRALQPKPATP